MATAKTTALTFRLEPGRLTVMVPLRKGLAVQGHTTGLGIYFMALVE